MTESRFDERRLGELLSLLQPAPQGWVEAAKTLPEARRQIESIVELAESDAAYRAQVLEDLEEALRQRGIEPTSDRVTELEARLR